MKHNKKRNESFSRKSLGELASIVSNGTLGSACAMYHLKKNWKYVEYSAALEKTTKNKPMNQVIKGVLDLRE